MPGVSPEAQVMESREGSGVVLDSHSHVGWEPFRVWCKLGFSLDCSEKQASASASPERCYQPLSETAFVKHRLEKEEFFLPGHPGTANVLHSLLRGN